MASGTITGASRQGFYIFCDWSSTTNVAGNYSTVTANLYMYRAGSISASAVKSGALRVGGTVNGFTKVLGTLSGAGSVHLYGFSENVAHSSDGTGSWAAGAWFSPKITYNGVSIDTLGYADQNITLDTIPRTSQVSLSKTNFNIGETITVNTNRSSSSFTHTLFVQRSDGLYYDPFALIEGDSFSWKTDDGWYNIYSPYNYMGDLYHQIPDSNYYVANLLLRTWNGDTHIGDSTIQFTAYVTNANPTFTSF